MPESYNFSVNPGDYLYVVVWNEDPGTPKMWTGQFTLPNGNTLLSNTTQWQFVVAGGGNPGAYGALPALSAVGSTIAHAAWTPPHASAPYGTQPWGTFPGISSSAQFIWGDTLAPFSSSDGHYLIFRTAVPVLPVKHGGGGEGEGHTGGVVKTGLPHFGRRML
jgi:hypothetical protein